LRKLNRIIHPRVIGIIRKQIKDAGAKAIILDAPLLIEAGLIGLADKIIIVKANKEKQISRLLNNTPLTRVDILKRIRSQVPLHVKARFADFIIDNSGTIKETRKQVEQIRRKLWKN
jgi:dephospho-CoA kinase